MAGPAGAVEVLESREDVLKKLDDEPGMKGAYDLLKPGGKMREFFLNEVEASRCKDSRSHRYSPTFVRLRGVVPRFDAPPMGAREFDGAHWLALSHACGSLKCCCRAMWLRRTVVWCPRSAGPVSPPRFHNFPSFFYFRPAPRGIDALGC